MVFAIFLSLLAISLAACLKIAESSQKRLDYEMGKSAFSEFASKAGSACALGSGNVRIVSLQKGEATVSQNGSRVSFSSGGFSSPLALRCPFSLQGSLASSSLRIENNEGTLEISGYSKQA
jgi:hypothetical protein